MKQKREIDFNNYVVYPDGTVYGKHNKRCPKTRIDRLGYHKVFMSGHWRLLHRVVATLYLPNHENKKEVNHN